MEINALFTSLVAGTIFLLGFLITGVLSDYTESEKSPSDLTASLKSEARRFLDFQKSFTNSLLDWFHKKEITKST